MIARWHLLTGEYPPVAGGIAQYVAAMADALAARGAEVHVWTASDGMPDGSGRVAVHQLPDRFGPRSRAALEQGTRLAPGRVLLHYTPNALGSRGANLAFCRWFAARGRQNWDARVMFHEPFMYFGRQSPGRNLLALVHRTMAAALLRTNDDVYVSTPSWPPLLQRYSVRHHRWRWIPITAGSPRLPSADATSAARSIYGCSGARRLAGTFGTYAAETAEDLRHAIIATLAKCPDLQVVCLGRNSREFVASLGSPRRVSASGELGDEELSAAIAACDLMLQPFPEGVTCRRTSLLRVLAGGAPVLTTAGRYTEPIWAASGAVSLARAGDAEDFARTATALLADDDARARLGDAALRLYESTFCPDAVVRALMSEEHHDVVLVGTHTWGATGPSARRQQAAVQSFAGLRRARAASVEHAASPMSPRVDGVEYLPILREDSVAAARTGGRRKAIASEVFAELARRAIAADSRYFLYANSDVRICQQVVDRVLQGDRLAYLFWRTDTDADGSNAALLSEGIDVFAIDARWYTVNAWRFRPYIIGERTWDNVYAAILGVHANAAFIAAPGWALHERHERAWIESPFQPYLRYLSALDHQYFARWCRFWDRARGAALRGATDDIEAIAAEAFGTTPRRVDRAVQWGRNIKAKVRYQAGRA